MKPKEIALIIVVLIFLIIGAKVCSASPENPTRQELLQTVKHIEALAKETQAELDAEKAAHSQTQNALDAATQANQDSQTQFASYQKAAEIEIKKGNDAIVKLAALVKKHHIDLAILIALWLGVVGLLYLKLGYLVGAAGIYAAGVGAAAGVTFILWRL